LAGHRFDVLFHLAAYGVNPDDHDADTAAAVNIASTGALVAAAFACSAKAVIYTGSCAEYDARTITGPIDEEQPLTQRGIYATSKIAGGFWGSALAHQSGIVFCWLRLFGVYGPGEPLHRLIPYVAGRLRRDEVVDLTPGDQVRDWMFVDDMATGIVLAASLADRGRSGPFNLCTGRGTSVREVACMVADELGKPHRLLGFGRRPYRSDDALTVVGSPARFQAFSGFTPRYDVETGVRLAVRAS
jgi:nucleoside-diphosphate-sugar epimerase